MSKVFSRLCSLSLSRRTLARVMAAVFFVSLIPLIVIACYNYPADDDFNFVLPVADAWVRTGSLAVHGLGEAVTLTGEDHDMGVVDQPVNQCRCQPVVTKNGIPLGELQIGCNNQAPALIAVGDHLEKQFGSILVEWDKANFVNDQ